MKVLHVVGNDIGLGNGIGRLVPELISNSNQYTTYVHELLYIQGSYISNEFLVYSWRDVRFTISKFIGSYDLVIFHGVYFWQYSLIFICLKFLGIPYLVKPHSSLMCQAQKKSWLKKNLANKLFFKRFWGSSSGILFTNSDEKNNSIQVDASCYIEPNGITLPDLTFDYKEKNSLNFVALSRIDFSHKGIDILFDALEILKSRNLLDQITLDIYGKGGRDEEAELLSRLSSLDVPSVKFLGALFGDKKYYMFNSKTVFMSSSRYEGFPMAILEAMYSGLPCLVTEGTNMTEIVKENNVGWVVSTGADSLADGIAKILELSPSEIYEKSINAKNYVVNNHNWETVTKLSLDIYKDVLGE